MRKRNENQPKLQPFRLISGWFLDWNTFMELDPIPENKEHFSGSSLLLMSNLYMKKSICVEWRPEFDIEGMYIIYVINIESDKKTKTWKSDWKKIFEFRCKDRLEAVSMIERLAEFGGDLDKNKSSC